MNLMKKFLLLIICIILVSGSNVNAMGWTQTITPYFNSLTLYVNGKELPGDTILYQGTTYIPIRAAATALGGDVQWDESTRSAYITTKRTDYIADVIKWCDNGEQFMNDLAQLADCTLEYCYSEEYRDSYHDLMKSWLNYAKEDFLYMASDTELYLKLRYIGVDINSEGVKAILDNMNRYLNDFESYTEKTIEFSANAPMIYDLMADKLSDLREYSSEYIIGWKTLALSRLY